MRSLLANRWMFVPVVLLAGNVLFAFVTVRLALRDHGNAAEPDYYRRAVEWDSARAARTAGERLRWTVSPSLSRRGDGSLAVKLVIADRQGYPIDGAEVSVEAIPVRAADLVEARACTETGDGAYEVSFPVRATGQWEFRVRIERGEDRLEERFRRMVEPTLRVRGADAAAPHRGVPGASMT